MCEFKIIRKKDDSQLTEDIVVISYDNDNKLVLKDIIGLGTTLDSALILEVNTLNQKTVILENPIVKHFINLLVKINDNSATASDADIIINKLELLKGELSK
ncbi:MAG: CooT family nickel-binding protein [Candidatus Thorarchaeota archaeon]